MAGRDELGDQALPDGTSRAGHEDPHNDSFRRRTTPGGRRAFITHGDGLTEQHWSGELLHWLLRQPVTIALFRLLHPAIGFWIADRLSGTLADNTKDKAVLDRAAAAQAAYAEALLERRPELSLVVMAHTHRARLEQVDGGRVYVNPGAFLDGGRYAVITKESVELKNFQ